MLNPMTPQADTKEKVIEFWEEQSCGTQFTEQEKHSRQYFEEIEAYRYSVEPEIHSFAQFTRHRGQRLLEVGVGAGTDFLQWVRAGTEAYGVDITQEAIDNVAHRLDVYGLKARDLRLADAESLPYEDNFFDVVYSWGVIHHSPDTQRALEEIIRVTRPGGTCKIMLYHRQSLASLFMWVRWGLMAGKPWKTLSWCIANHVESPGTKAYNPSEVRSMLKDLPVENIDIRTISTYYDVLGNLGPVIRTGARSLSYLLGKDRVGWFLTLQMNKKS